MNTTTTNIPPSRPNCFWPCNSRELSKSVFVCMWVAKSVPSKIYECRFPVCQDDQEANDRSKKPPMNIWEISVSTAPSKVRSRHDYILLRGGKCTLMLGIFLENLNIKYLQELGREKKRGCACSAWAAAVLPARRCYIWGRFEHVGAPTGGPFGLYIPQNGRKPRWHTPLWPFPYIHNFLPSMISVVCVSLSVCRVSVFFVLLLNFASFC